MQAARLLPNREEFFVSLDNLITSAQRQRQTASYVGSCCVRVGSGVQTDATTPKKVWDLQYIVGRIQPIRLCNPCVMSVRGPNNVGRALQLDPTLLRYASAITERKKC